MNRPPANDNNCPYIYIYILRFVSFEISDFCDLEDKIKLRWLEIETFFGYHQLMVNCWSGLVVWDSRATPK